MAEESKDPTRDSGAKEESDSTDEPTDVVDEGTGELPEDETPAERVDRLSKGDLREGEWTEDISDTVAPSVGPKSVLVHRPAHDDRDNIDRDAMGKDKRRQVVGESYGASFAKQAAVYGGSVAVVVALLIGAKLLVDKADQPPDHVAIQAVWAQPGARQHTPKPLE